MLPRKQSLDGIVEACLGLPVEYKAGWMLLCTATCALRQHVLLTFISPALSLLFLYFSRLFPSPPLLGVCVCVCVNDDSQEAFDTVQKRDDENQGEKPNIY